MKKDIDPYDEEIWEDDISGSLSIGDFVGDPDVDWGGPCYWPCVVTKIIDNNTVEIAECCSYDINNKRGYKKRKISNLKMWGQNEQLKWYKRTKKSWLDFIKQHKNYEN